MSVQVIWNDQPGEEEERLEGTRFFLMTAGIMSLTSWEKEATVSLGRSGKLLGVENIWLGFMVVRNWKSQ